MAHRKQTAITDVVLNDGFWYDRHRASESQMRESVRAALDNPENSAGFVNFRIAAGMESGNHMGTHWSDGDCYKYLEGLSHLYGYSRDKGILAELREKVALVKAAQEDDGYINTQIQIPGAARWVTRLHHEDYNLGHLFTAAVVNNVNTGDTELLRVACNAADNLYERFITRWRDAGQFGWNPTHIPGLVELYRVTGERRYIDLAKLFLDTRGAEDHIETNPHPTNEVSDLNQMGVPFREETIAVGHAVTAAYLYQGAAEVAAEQDDAQLLATAETIWNDITKRKLYITGGIGAHHFWVSSRGHEVHEAFGREYQLPHYLAYNETCANIAFGMFSRSMTEITGEAKYADAAELVLYNAGLSGTSLDGVKFRYANPLRWYADLGEAGSDRHLSHATHDRWETRGCYCCPPQVFRLLASVQNWLCVRTDNGIAVNHFASATISEKVVGESPVNIEMTTDYPWDGLIKITVNRTPDEAWELSVRIPGWAEGAEVTLEGGSIADVRAGQYVQMKRTWKPGDVVTVQLPMAPRLMRANPMVEEARNQVAVMRGPLVYCLEGADMPEGSSVHRIAMISSPQMQVEMVEEFAGYGRVAVLKATALEEPVFDGERLYDTVPSDGYEEIEVQLIPYYAWNNRGKNDMTVWFPLISR